MFRNIVREVMVRKKLDQRDEINRSTKNSRP